MSFLVGENGDSKKGKEDLNGLYQVDGMLLILISGCQSEVREEWSLRSVSCFDQGAKLPMSIIIVGVGQAEFDGKSINHSCSHVL